MAQLDDLLVGYQPFDEEEAAIVRQLKQFLASSDNAYDRSNLVAHVVADAWIVNPARTHVVLVEHLLNKMWLAPGGHCDGDSDVRGAALREAEKEAGLNGLRPLLGGGLFDVAGGMVPSRRKTHGIEPAHLHFDICFAFEAPDDVELVISDESTDLRWVAVEDIHNLNFAADRKVDESHKLTFMPVHRRRVEKTLQGKLA